MNINQLKNIYIQQASGEISDKKIRERVDIEFCLQPIRNEGGGGCPISFLLCVLCIL